MSKTEIKLIKVDYFITISLKPLMKGEECKQKIKILNKSKICMLNFSPFSSDSNVS